MTDRITYRVIDGCLYRCQDIGCPDFDRAERNREMVKNGERTLGYLVVEMCLSATPLTRRLPSWVPQGELPIVNKKDWQQYGGDKGGLYEEE